MPIVTVHGTESGHPVDFRNLRGKIKADVAAIPELKITPDLVSVFFPSENAPVTGEIVVFIDGLLSNTRRTPAVISKLAEVVGKAIQGHRMFDRPPSLVEVLVRSIHTGDVLWSSADETDKE
jgi:hypothetical protein